MHDYMYVYSMYSRVTNKCLVLKKIFYNHLQTFLNIAWFEQTCV